jgi:hypothetical protein
VPTISMFYGIVIRMYYFDTQRHTRPHVHAEYGGCATVFAIDDCTLLAGDFPPRQRRLVEAWIEVQRESLAADWILAVQGATLFAIEPLR